MPSLPTLSTLPAWSDEHGLVPLLRTVEDVLAPDVMLVLGLLLAGSCLARGQVRVALFVAGTVTLTSYATTALKAAIGRERPAWQLTEHVHNGGSLPSGHSSAVGALVGVAVVVAWFTATDPVLRRHRTHATIAIGAVACAVVGLDRILLGRHYPIDVLAGLLLAAAVTIVVGVLTGVVPRRRTAPATADAVADHLPVRVPGPTPQRVLVLAGQRDRAA